MFVEVAILIPFCLINIAEGLRNLDRELIEMGRSFTRREMRILWRLTLPLLVPYGLSATRIAYGVAWKIALVAELLGASNGVGYLMLRAQTAADSTTLRQPRDLHQRTANTAPATTSCIPSCGSAPVRATIASQSSRHAAHGC